MAITKEKLEKIYKLYDELELLANEATMAELDAKQNKDELATINDKEVKEQHLWDEYRYLGDKSPAGEYLTKKYPDLFQKVKVYNDKLEELKEYSVKELGINPLAMTLKDILKLIEASK